MSIGSMVPYCVSCDLGGLWLQTKPDSCNVTLWPIISKQKGAFWENICWLDLSSLSLSYSINYAHETLEISSVCVILGAKYDILRYGNKHNKQMQTNTGKLWRHDLILTF